MDANDQSISVEWVLIALLSVFALDAISNILVFVGVLTATTSLSVLDVFTIEMLPGFVISSVYWLAGVGVLWGIAHRLGFRRAFVLVGIGAGVSVGLTVLFSGASISPFWMAVHTGRAALMGWLLWRLAYRASVLNAGPVPKSGSGGYQTTIGRAFFALLCGSFVGVVGSIVIAMIIFGGFSSGDIGGILGVVSGFWLGGVFVFGGISIAVLHNIGLRQWYGLTIAGGLIMLLIGLVVLDGFSEEQIFPILAGVGCVTGWIIWRVAYRRAPLEG